MSDSINKLTYDINKTCRACLNVEVLMKSIINGHLRDLFTKFTNLEISESDGLPSKLCSSCIEKLNNSFTFLELCLKSDRFLKQQKLIKSENDEEIKAENTQSSNGSDIPVNNFLEVKYLPKYESESSIEIKEENISGNVESDENFIENDDNYMDDSEVEDNLSLSVRKTRSKRKRKSVKIGRPTRKRKLEEVEISESTISEPKDYNLNLCCPICKAEFLKPDRLEAHYRVHLGQKPEVCEICNMGFSKLERLEKHMKQHAKCLECGEIFNNRGDLRVHKRIHKKIKSFICHICGKSVGKNLKAHMTQNHSDDKPFPCNICPKAFKMATALKMHLLRHAGTKKYICNKCGHGTLTRNHLERHMGSHSDEKPFSCQYCPKKYKRQSHLAEHTKIHTGQRPFTCDLCPLTFRTGRVMQNHRMTHTGEKPHVCSDCGKAFIQKIALVSHMKIHK